MSDRPRILVTVRRPLYALLFAPETEARLRALGDVELNEGERDWSAEELAERLVGVDAAVIGWGTVCLDDAVLERADRLRFVAHSGGSIKEFVAPEAFERGIMVTHAASAIAGAVAELSLVLAILALRRITEIDLKSPSWLDSISEEYDPGYEIGGQRVGVVGAGWIGRAAIRLFQAVGAEVWVHDPYLTAERAAELGVTPVSLDELLAGCRVVAMHAPITEETYHLIGARELALLRDGAVFVNTARGKLVDQRALEAELVAGRIVAGLDVFEEEPLPDDSPLRGLPNVVLLPHLAGSSVQARLRQGETVVEDLRRFLAGEPLKNQVTLEMLSTMA